MSMTEGATLESAAANAEAFPAAKIEKELNPGMNTEVEVDPVSSQVAADMELKEQAEVVEQKRDKDMCDNLRTLKSAIMISAAIVAVAGAAFAITKKLKEK